MELSLYILQYQIWQDRSDSNNYVIIIFMKKLRYNLRKLIINNPFLAIKMRRRRSAYSQGYRNSKNDATTPLAIVIHVFYVDLLNEIFQYLDKLDVNFKLYVTTPFNCTEHVKNRLEEKQYKHVLLGVKNQGRDIFPFLKIMPLVVEAKHEFVLKIHTKKSSHCSFGDEWRQDIFLKLLDKNLAKKTLQYFQKNLNIGMIAPQGYLLSNSINYSNNEKNIAYILRELGTIETVFSNLSFPAGSMFYARTAALEPLINLHLHKEKFAIERGQIDGTLAHAIERGFGASVYLCGADLIDTSQYQKMNNKGYFSFVEEQKKIIMKRKPS